MMSSHGFGPGFSRNLAFSSSSQYLPFFLQGKATRRALGRGRVAAFGETTARICTMDSIAQLISHAPAQISE